MRRKIKRLVIFVICMILLTVSLTACGGKQPEVSAEAPSEDKITLRFFSALPDRTAGLGLLEEKMLAFCTDSVFNVVGADPVFWHYGFDQTDSKIDAVYAAVHTGKFQHERTVGESG